VIGVIGKLAVLYITSCREMNVKEDDIDLVKLGVRQATPQSHFSTLWEMNIIILNAVLLFWLLCETGKTKERSLQSEMQILQLAFQLHPYSLSLNASKSPRSLTMLNIVLFD
jgi:hypothetical protein